MGFSASVPEMNDFSGKMQQKHDAIGGMITAAQQAATAVRNGKDFQGTAGDTFERAMENFLRAAQKLNDELNENAQKVKTIASQFSDNELENYKRIHAADVVEVPQLNM
ncbi:MULTISPECIES: WXG100 family type VII secretion target [Nocardia]|uniref:WXG100 family type VII secretion target n=2 Tax=Nocardia TaxID=1817 RepID=A0A2T2YQN7_9NOCA|nr:MULTISPECIES: WXG100 family type VII secretion target [Nocardia]MBF6242218.1 WXG100 family type VII secretion target [Nocardia elegans]MBF6446951.1 WXG100 family type VII secretion target [Nocardia elegans]PPJ15356.1 hypothetical protein C5E44_20770 [Nocardia nova]PSR57835.1 hypothetical protein C8259_33135 [Nocardia nova]